MFEGRSQPQFCPNRNCFKLLVKMITASPIARYPSFKFDDAGAAFRILGGECGPFYPRSPCSQTSRTASTDELACGDFVFLRSIRRSPHSRLRYPLTRLDRPHF